MQIEASYGEFAGAGGDHVLSALQFDQVAAGGEARESGFQFVAAVAFKPQFAHQLLEVGPRVRQLGNVGDNRRVVHSLNFSSNFICNRWQNSAVGIILEEAAQAEAPTGPPPT